MASRHRVRPPACRLRAGAARSAVGGGRGLTSGPAPCSSMAVARVTATVPADAACGQTTRSPGHLSATADRRWGCESVPAPPDALGEGIERVDDVLGDPRPVALPAARTFEDARVLELLDGTLGRRQGDASGGSDVGDVTAGWFNRYGSRRRAAEPRNEALMNCRRIVSTYPRGSPSARGSRPTSVNRPAETGTVSVRVTPECRSIACTSVRPMRPAPTRAGRGGGHKRRGHREQREPVLDAAARTMPCAGSERRYRSRPAGLEVDQEWHRHAGRATPGGRQGPCRR